MQSVKLEDGSVILPEMVCGDKLPSHSFGVIFLPNEDYIQTFIEENQALLSHFQKQTADRVSMTTIIYHSMPIACTTNPLYAQ